MRNTFGKYIMLMNHTNCLFNESCTEKHGGGAVDRAFALHAED